jgi:hypothetical protein
MSANFDFGLRSPFNWDSSIPDQDSLTLSIFTLMNGSTTDGGGESLFYANTDLPYHATNGSGNFSTEYNNTLQLRHSLFWTVVIIFAYVVVFAVGIVGNAMVISVLTMKRQMRTVTNMFILNLAIADMSVVIFCLIPNLLANIFVRKYNHFIQYFIIYKLIMRLR